MEEIYWLTRLDGLRTCLTVFLVISCIALAIFIIVRIATEQYAEWGSCLEYNKRWVKIASGWIKGLIPGVIVFATSLVFVPSTKEAFLIYGVGGAIDFVRSDETAKKLPHKVVLAADKYLEELLSDDDTLKKKKRSRDEEDD